MAAATHKKLRILCLHGFTQNGKVFRDRTGSLRKALRSRAEFVFATAPHTADLHDTTQMDSKVLDDPRAWWTSGENKNSALEQDATSSRILSEFVRPSESHRALGFENSLDYLRSLLAAEGPFDGILGFSQGASMAVQLLATEPAAFNFAVLIAGFVPHDPELAQRISLSKSRLSKHVVFSVSGTADAMVSSERIAALAECFETNNVSHYSHSGGHGIPTSPDFRETLMRFLEQAGPTLAGPMGTA